MIVNGKVQEAVAANLKARLSDVAKRKEVLLGSNQFPNFTEVAAKKIKADAGACSSICNCKTQPQAACGCGDKCENALPTLPVARAAEEFEALRLETEGAKKQPVAFMLTIGNLAMRIARAQFSCNFLACAGYKVIDNNGFKTVKEGIKAARKAKADIIVLCSSDDEYATFAPQAWLELENAKEMFIVAGAPACMEDLQKLGIKNFIHVRCNVLETLKQYNAQLLNK
jgi:methylmalonyl-CoA mutase